MIRVKEEQPKCEFGHCEHPPEDHHEGTCWKIIRPELKDEPTNRKYCDCCVTMEPRSKKSIKGWQEIAHYEGNGWMEAEPCLECSKNDDKIPSGLIIVCVDPKSKIGKPKECPTCLGKGTTDIMATMECQKCKKVSLIRTDIKLCLACEERPIKPVNYYTGKEIEKTLIEAQNTSMIAQKLFDEQQVKRDAKNKALFKKHNI
tara:strand:- start:4930 stop:5535 length:606 start_codon:yes stop_codon:yes gene_type:complete